MSSLVLIGLNHRTSDVAMRERVAFQPASLPEALRALSARPGIQEALIFSTCNRVELLACVENLVDGLGGTEEFLSEYRGVNAEQIRSKLYRYADDEAVRHVFRVASSLDSMILGEPQILGQVKSFYGTAVETGTIGPQLNSLLQASFHTAKRVRNETNIGEYSVSVSSAAVELARKIFGDLRGKAVLIIGAGKMGEVAIRHIASAGARAIRVTNRSRDAAQQLAEKFHGDAVPFEEKAKWIAQSDIIITSTGAQEILVDQALTRNAMAERKNTPIVFIDISVPRNVDPSIGTIDNVFCYNIDDLGSVVEANLQERRREAGIAERIVDQEVQSFCTRQRAADMAPIVAELRRRIHEICRMELERYIRKTGAHSTEARRELEGMMARIAAKIAHPLITQARNGHRDSDHHSAYLETIKRIFKLQKDTEP